MITCIFQVPEEAEEAVLEMTLQVVYNEGGDTTELEQLLQDAQGKRLKKEAGLS
jgi:hypothetical protein